MTKEEALETLLDNAENGMVDVEEVKLVFSEIETKTGHWIEYPHETGPNWEFSKYACSECASWFDDDSNYCPDCGARMENGR